MTSTKIVSFTNRSCQIGKIRGVLMGKKLRVSLNGLLEELARKEAELAEARRTIEQKDARIHTLVQRVQELEQEVAQLTDTLAQQKVRIKAEVLDLVYKIADNFQAYFTTQDLMNGFVDPSGRYVIYHGSSNVNLHLKGTILPEDSPAWGALGRDGAPHPVTVDVPAGRYTHVKKVLSGITLSDTDLRDMSTIEGVRYIKEENLVFMNKKASADAIARLSNTKVRSLLTDLYQDLQGAPLSPAFKANFYPVFFFGELLGAYPTTIDMTSSEVLSSLVRAMEELSDGSQQMLMVVESNQNTIQMLNKVIGTVNEELAQAREAGAELLNAKELIVEITDRLGMLSLNALVLASVEKVAINLRSSLVELQRKMAVARKESADPEVLMRRAEEIMNFLGTTVLKQIDKIAQEAAGFGIVAQNMGKFNDETKQASDVINTYIMKVIDLLELVKTSTDELVTVEEELSKVNAEMTGLYEEAITTVDRVKDGAISRLNS